MRSRLGLAALALTVASTLLVGVPLDGASADVQGQGATVTHSRGTFSCAGDSATLTWTPPTDLSGVTGYHIASFTTTPNTPATRSWDVGLEQTSLEVGVLFGITSFRVFVVTSEGTASDAFAEVAGVVGSSAPLAMEWARDWSSSSVGDGTATVSFEWWGTNEWANSGLLPVTVRVAAAPGGGTTEGPTAEFTGLTNGVGYTFSAVTSNGCGARSSSIPATPTFVPGVAPMWTRNSPPLKATPGEYKYKFQAAGTPAPTYRLEGAPSWLTISSDGKLLGRPPRGTQSFTYSVVASNGVGIHPDSVFGSTDAVAGPFEVTLRP